jgi:uncharacterized alkaline shock family protein YloU
VIALLADVADSSASLEAPAGFQAACSRIGQQIVNAIGDALEHCFGVDWNQPPNLFLLGMLCGLGLFLILRLASWFFWDRRCKGIALRNDAGGIFITAAAIQDFISRVLADNGQMIVEKVSLRELKDGGHAVTIHASLLPEARVPELADLVQQRVLSKVREHLGVLTLRAVDLQLRSFSAKEGALERQHRRALREARGEAEIVLSNPPPAD